MIHEHDKVVLTLDVPSHGLKAGDMGIAVYVFLEGGCMVEFMTLEGETIAVVTLDKDQVRPIESGDIPHARKLETAA